MNISLPPLPTPAQEWMDEPSRRVSICCECGNVREAKSTHSARGGRRGEPGALSRATDEERCTELLKCQTCDATTKHAYIRNDARRNAIEEDARGRALPAVPLIEVPGLDVEVCYVHDRGLALIRPGLSPEQMTKAMKWLAVESAPDRLGIKVIEVPDLRDDACWVASQRVVLIRPDLSKSRRERLMLDWLPEKIEELR